MNQPMPPDEVDQLLSAFFKAELPEPFPVMTATAIPASAPMPAVALERPRRKSNHQAKLSLAVSVALLIGGCWYLSSRVSGGPEGTRIGNGDNSAKLPKELLKGNAGTKKPMP